MASKLGPLTRGEKLILSRRRDKKTQKQAATTHKVGLSQYREWERDESNPPATKLGKVLPHERCFIHRRRAGHTLPTVATELGRCRYWVNQMELGKQDGKELLKYWEG